MLHLDGNYIILDIKPKDGELRPIHADVIGCECFFLEDIKEGDQILMSVHPNYLIGYDHKSFRPYHTSIVVNAYIDDLGTLYVETQNTHYTFVKL